VKRKPAFASTVPVLPPRYRVASHRLPPLSSTTELSIPLLPLSYTFSQARSHGLRIPGYSLHFKLRLEGSASRASNSRLFPSFLPSHIHTDLVFWVSQTPPCNSMPGTSFSRAIDPTEARRSLPAHFISLTPCFGYPRHSSLPKTLSTGQNRHVER
jgi:hypothetical protein